MDLLREWLEKRGTRPNGPPFIRYHVINMATKLDIELGFPVAAPASDLLEWGAKQGLKWDQSDSKEGDAFGARLDGYLKDPMSEKDPAKWETEVAIRLAER